MNRTFETTWRWKLQTCNASHKVDASTIDLIIVATSARQFPSVACIDAAKLGIDGCPADFDVQAVCSWLFILLADAIIKTGSAIRSLGHWGKISLASLIFDHYDLRAFRWWGREPLCLKPRKNQVIGDRLACRRLEAAHEKTHKTR
jgi:hypothetical protein